MALQIQLNKYLLKPYYVPGTVKNTVHFNILPLNPLLQFSNLKQITFLKSFISPGWKVVLETLNN